MPPTLLTDLQTAQLRRSSSSPRFAADTPFEAPSPGRLSEDTLPALTLLAAPVRVCELLIIELLLSDEAVVAGVSLLASVAVSSSE